LLQQFLDLLGNNRSMGSTNDSVAAIGAGECLGATTSGLGRGAVVAFDSGEKLKRAFLAAVFPRNGGFRLASHPVFGRLLEKLSY